MEDPQYNEFHSRIVGSMFMTNGGITSIASQITDITSNSISFVVAVIIIARVFIKTSGETNGFALLEVGLLYSLIVIGCVALTVRNSKKGKQRRVWPLQKLCHKSLY